VLALGTANAASQNQKLGPPAAENSLRHQRPHDLQPEQLASGFHKAAGLNHHRHHTRGLKAVLASGADLPARPRLNRPHSLGVAGHLLMGDGGMQQKHQAGVTQFASHRQTLGRSKASFLEAALQVDLAAAAREGGITDHSGRRWSWMRPMGEHITEAAHGLAVNAGAMDLGAGFDQGDAEGKNPPYSSNREITSRTRWALDSLGSSWWRSWTRLHSAWR
jgi:hypothetical protein